MKKRRKKIMKVILILVVIIVLVVVGFIGYQSYQLSNLNKMSTDDMISYVTSGSGTYVSMAIIDNGNVEYHTYGQNGVEIDRKDLQFEIGSISKTMAALLTAKAIKEGKIDLSASISDYLDLPKDHYYPTIDRLLTHTSGYKNYYLETQMISNHLRGRNDFYGVTREQILEKAASVSLEDRDYPFVYSNFGLSVIGLVLEKVYQQDYTTLMNDFLHNDLGLTHTNVATGTGNLSGYWEWAPNDGYIPAGAIISDIEDMTKYLNIYMNGSLDYARKPLEIIKKVNYNKSFYNALGIYVHEAGMTWLHDAKHHVFWHNGGTTNYNSHIAMNDDFTKGIVILSNYGPTQKFPVTVIGVRMME